MGTMRLPDALRCDRWVVALAAAASLLHLCTTGGYGIFRDELYYLACAQHLDWGYVDHPPLVGLVAWLVRNTLGASLFALRLLPALAAGGLVLLTAAITRQLGGGRFAQLLAGLSVALAPIYLGLLSTFSMNAFDLLVWAALLLVVVRLLRTEDRRLWLVFGVLAGIGLQNKISVLFLGFGVAIGLLLERRWRDLRGRHLWLGLGLAALLIAPHVAWQVAHGWPTAEFVRGATENKNLSLSPLAFFMSQVRMMNPLALPLWLLGLGALFFLPALRPFRLLGWAYLAVLGLMVANNAKSYYLAPIYPALLAAGATTLERLSQALRWRWTRPASLALLALSGAARAPLAKPLLPVETYVAYARALGHKPGTDERKTLDRLPQFFADMHGWEQLAQVVAQAHATLTPAERARACVFGQNYGQAGAIDLYGPSLGLPTAISRHNSYWMWGPRGCSGEVMIIIGGRRERHLRNYADVRPAATFDCQDCMPYEDNLTIWIARSPLRSLTEIWPTAKHYD
jgi:hypothetical protein